MKIWFLNAIGLARNMMTALISLMSDILTMDENQCNINLPEYPEFYDPRTVCKWNLTTDKGNFISLDFECIRVSDRDNVFICLNAF